MVNSRQSSGYILPTAMVFFVVSISILVLLIQFTAVINNTVQSTVNISKATKTADAGLIFAANCINSNLTATWGGSYTSPTTLTPERRCNGSTSGSSYFYDNTSTKGAYALDSTVNSGTFTMRSNGTISRPNGVTVQDRTMHVDVPIKELGVDNNSHMIAQGDWHTCTVAAGEVYCWGYNDYGQLGDGTTTDRTTPTRVDTLGTPLEGKTVTSVAAGKLFTCALAQSEVYCWGQNVRGQLGDGTRTQRTKPVKVEVDGTPLDGKRITHLAAGGWNTCVIAEGRPYCWGVHTYGSLGNGAPIHNGNNFSHDETRPVAVRVSGTDLATRPAESISVGFDTICVIAAGDMYCWGNGNHHIIGDGTSNSRNVPTKFNKPGTPLNGKVIDSVSVGFNHNCITSEFDLYCWGYNNRGQVGNGTLANVVATPTLVMSDIVVKVSSGSSHTCAIGLLYTYCWGRNSDGELGVGSNSSAITSPAVTDTMDPSHQFSVTEIYAGRNITCAVSVGKPYCWGRNNHGSVGDGTTTNRNSPRAVRTSGTLMHNKPLISQKFSEVLSSGQQHSCRVYDGEAYCWGNNGDGQLGDGTTSSRHHPVKVKTAGTDMEGKVVSSITTQERFTCAIAEGSLYCWGRNDHGQLGDGTTTRRTTPVKAFLPAGLYAQKVVLGDSHSCVIATANAYCWGRNNSGQLGDGTKTDRTTPTQVQGSNLYQVLDITAAVDHTCAIFATVTRCWGGNGNGRLGVGDTNERLTPTPIAGGISTQVQEVTSGNWHTCFLASGDVYCSGSHSGGRVGNGQTSGSSTTPVQVSLPGKASAIDAGDDHTCAIVRGKIYCWGRNHQGQLGDGTTSDKSTPAAVSMGSNEIATVIASGYEHTCAAINGFVQCWGRNGSGRLGNNSTTQSLTPTSSINTLYQIDKSYRY